MTQLTEITEKLSAPFATHEIALLPKGKVERNGSTFCMAMPYADPRAYQDRLNALAPGEWSTPAPIALTVGDKLVCYVTVVVCGIAHTDVGEAGPGENQGTEAFSQAFKRACSQFGLGRYLYDLEKAWVPYDAQRKRIDLDENGLRNVVRQMYSKAGIAPSESAHNGSNGHHTTDALELKAIMSECRALGLASDTASWHAWKLSVLHYQVANKALKAEELSLLRDAIEEYKLADVPSAA